MMEKICQHCGYNWVPRVADPKECPVCKRRLRRPVNTEKAEQAEKTNGLLGILSKLQKGAQETINVQTLERLRRSEGK